MDTNNSIFIFVNNVASIRYIKIAKLSPCIIINQMTLSQLFLEKHVLPKTFSSKLGVQIIPKPQLTHV